jgi:hypothetical protein
MIQCSDFGPSWWVPMDLSCSGSSEKPAQVRFAQHRQSFQFQSLVCVW